MKPKVIPQINLKVIIDQMLACNGSKHSIMAELYRVHRYEAAALEPRTYRDQRQRCRADLDRQHCVHEPAIAATFS